MITQVTSGVKISVETFYRPDQSNPLYNQHVFAYRITITNNSKKVRGGIGVQLGFGIGLSFTYILFMQISNTFAINGIMPPLIAVWLPNLIFAIIGVALLRNAPK